MRITATGTLGFLLSLTFVVQSNFASASYNYKCKNPACDISAIGHRNLSGGRGVGNWYSIEKQKELGEKYAAVVEK